jgi:hypothetical protein
MDYVEALRALRVGVGYRHFSVGGPPDMAKYGVVPTIAGKCRLVYATYSAAYISTAIF